MQDCLSLGEKLKQELADAGYIPEGKLSGELAEALRTTRRLQLEKLEQILKELSILTEER